MRSRCIAKTMLAVSMAGLFAACAATRSPGRIAADSASELQVVRANSAVPIERQYAIAQRVEMRERVISSLPPGGARTNEVRALLSDLSTEDATCSELDPMYQNVVGICTRSLESSRGEFTTAQTVTLVLVSAGAIAGSIAVPALVAASAANAVWVAGFGGLSGGVNAMMLTSREVGASPDKISAARVAFLAEWNPLVDAYATHRAAGECPQAAAALDKAYFRCLTYLNGIAAAEPVTPLRTPTPSPSATATSTPTPTPTKTP